MGHLELKVMETMWSKGQGSVHDVVGWLDRPLAYNTVMTTLDRLFKKGLLRRNKQDRAYQYSPRMSQLQWRESQARELLSGFLAGPRPVGEILVSCLVDAVGEYDSGLLDQLEEEIRAKRIALDRGREP